MDNFFKRTSTWYILAFLVIFALVGWAYKAGVFQSSSAVAYQGQAGKTVLELLESKYQVQTQKFSSGEAVTSINGKKADSTHSWVFTVNGAPTTVDASAYVTKDGDQIEWRLKEINSSL